MGIKRQLIRVTNVGLIGLGRTTSPKLAMRLANGIARRFKLDPRLNKRRLKQNLSQYFPDRETEWIETTARELQANAARAKIFDKHFLPRLRAKDFNRITEVVGLENLQGVIDSGRGAVCVMLHYGRFWAAGVWCSLQGFNTMAFQAADGRLPDQERTLSGGSFNASNPMAALQAVRALKQGAVVFVILDAGRVPNPVIADFLGQPTLFSTSPIRLAKAADAVIVPVLVPSHPADANRMQITFFEPVDSRDLPRDVTTEDVLRRFLDPFEQQVLATPSQWYGFVSAHRRMAQGGDDDL